MARIEICGGIATGKTTLAKLLQTIGLLVIYEDFSAVPFWRDFYKDPKEYGFQTEVGFLLQHYHQIQKATDANEWTVCDYSLVQDRAYAEINLERAAKRAFSGVYTYICDHCGPPTLLVHLKCEETEQLHRIRHRARPEEAGVDLRYLITLNKAVSKYVLSLGNNVRLLEIQSDEYNFADDDRDKAAVRERIWQTIRSLRSA